MTGTFISTTLLLKNYSPYLVVPSKERHSSNNPQIDIRLLTLAF